MREDNERLVREVRTWNRRQRPTPRCREPARRSEALRELWDEAETENDSLRVEAPTPACAELRSAASLHGRSCAAAFGTRNGLMDEHMDALRKALGPNATMKPLDPLDVEEMWDQANADERADRCTTPCAPGGACAWYWRPNAKLTARENQGTPMSTTDGTNAARRGSSRTTC